MTEKTRFDEMRDQFVAYHLANPLVYRYFVEFTRQLIGRGHKNGSAQSVIERIRWECALNRPDKDFKINNNWAGFYARMFMANYPMHDGFFRTRRRTSMDAPATNLPPLTPEDYPND